MSVLERFGCQPHVSCMHCGTTALLCLQLPSSCRERSPIDTFGMLSILFTASASVSLILAKERTLPTFFLPPWFPRPLPRCQFGLIRCCVGLNHPNCFCCLAADSYPCLGYTDERIPPSEHLLSLSSWTTFRTETLGPFSFRCNVASWHHFLLCLHLHLHFHGLTCPPFLFFFPFFLFIPIPFLPIPILSFPLFPEIFFRFELNTKSTMIVRT